MPCLLSFLNQFEKSLVEPKELDGSWEAVRGSKEILENLRSERYLKNLVMALENQQSKMLWGIKSVRGKTGKGKSIEIDLERH